MFYCDKCRVKNDWPEGFRMSFGPCEMCKTTTGCYDVPSSCLPPPKRAKTKAKAKERKSNVSKETVAKIRGGSSKMTCAEAAEQFRRWSERSGYAIDAAKLIAQAQVLEAFPGDTPVPQKLLDGWNLDD